MHLKTWGSPNAPKTALLIHGLASSSRSWRKIAPELVNKGYYVIAPDLPGHGETEWYGVYDINKIISLIVDTIDNRTIDLLMGHSMGGLIAAQLSLTLAPSKTVLIDPVFRFPGTAPIQYLAQKGFNFVMVRGISYMHTLKKRGTKAAILQIGETRTWDDTASKMLQPYPELVKQWTEEARDTLVVRPPISYILPKKILASDQIETVTIKGSHNVHLENHKVFMETVTAFLED